MLPAYGGVWKWDRFYTDESTGEELTKYIVVLAHSRFGDIVLRLLTSQSALRGVGPCNHDETRPGYYLGVVDPAVGLGKESWLDLRGYDDVEPETWDARVRDGVLTQVACLPNDVMCPALLCAIGARDTQKQQQAAIYETRAAIRC